jgi:hypothetical protein
MSENGPWGDLDLCAGASRSVDFGTLRMVLRRTDREIWLQSRRAPDLDSEDSWEWSRWAVPPDARVSLRPAAPDRPVVVSHEHPFHLPVRGQARVYVRIPLSVQVLVTSPELGELLIADEPSLVLSDTWWGTVIEGELAYWLETSARAEVSERLFVRHLAMCPFQLENVAQEVLHIERFAVRVLHLSLFSWQGQTWTDEVRVRYQGTAEGSAIDFSGQAPPEAPDAPLVASPRKPIRKGFQARTFERLRSLTMLGG